MNGDNLKMGKRSQDMFRLDGHDVLVTGASSGLGQRFALTLADAGASTVIVAARRVDKLTELKAEIEARGAASHAVSLDVTDAASIKAAFDMVASLGKTADI